MIKRFEEKRRKDEGGGGERVDVGLTHRREHSVGRTNGHRKGGAN